MILVFDLDDTLYEEKTFVFSGFSAVSSFLSTQFGFDKNEVYRELIEELKNGRGSIFDTILAKRNLYTKQLVNTCISVYRKHKSNIQLYDDALDCLKSFNEINKYLVTDGNKIVQKNKIDALEIEKYFSRCFISRRYGIQNEKPSPYCFMKICDIENTSPKNLVYIGDNPEKDFVGIKPLGFKTIRIMRGNYRNIVKSQEFEAHVQIDTLSEITPQFLEKLIYEF